MDFARRVWGIPDSGYRRRGFFTPAGRCSRTSAQEAIEKVRQKRTDDAVRDFRAWFDAALLPILIDFAELAGAKLTIRQDHFHDITAVFTGRCGFDITATQKRMRMALAAADHISVSRWPGSDEVEFSLIFGFPENEE